MSNQEEEGSGPLALKGFPSSPPYTPTTYGCRELEPQLPMESESYAPPTTYGYHSPQPLEFKYPDYPYSPPPPLKWPIPSYSWPLEYECPLEFELRRPLEVKCRAPSYGYECLTPPYSPQTRESEPLESECSAPTYSLQPLESECPAQTYSPLPLESDCRAPPYAPTTSYGCHSPHPLEFECESSASSPSPPSNSPQPLEFECESSPSSPSPPPYSPQPLESECRAPQHHHHYLRVESESPPYSPKPLESECPAPNFETPLTTSTDLKKPPLKFYEVTGLYAQIGLHCYNLHQAEDPIGNSTCYLNTEICYSNKVEGFMYFVVTRCLLKEEEVKRRRRCNERLVVDDFFKGRMPNWMPEDALTGCDKLQYYEMKESEVEQDKDWLQLYAQLAFFSFGFYPERTEPLGLRKVVVQTKEDVEPKKKAKSTNAIFYISFRSSAGQNFNAIIRRTTPEHMKLQVKCLAEEEGQGHECNLLH